MSNWFSSAVHQRGWIGDSPLHWPAHNGYTEIVRYLLDHGAVANAHEIGWIGGTPLHWASERHPAIVRMLVAAGADPNARVEKATPSPGRHSAALVRASENYGECITTLRELGSVSVYSGLFRQNRSRLGRRTQPPPLRCGPRLIRSNRGDTMRETILQLLDEQGAFSVIERLAAEPDPLAATKTFWEVAKHLYWNSRIFIVLS